MPASPAWRSAMKAFELGLRVLLVDDLVADVRAVEARDKARRVVEPEPVDDLAAGKVVGGGGQRDARHIRKAFGDDGKADIFRAEIVPPLRHAMRLVDREQGDVGAAEQAEAARRHQPLRRDIEQVEIAGQQPRLDGVGFLIGQRRIQHRRLDAGLEQAGDLVAHQRDQRRDHDAAALSQQRRQLIAQRLAAAGRHQHQAIAAAGDVPHDLFLRAAKAGQAEHVIQHRERIASEVGGALGSCGHGGRRHAVTIVRFGVPYIPTSRSFQGKY